MIFQNSYKCYFVFMFIDGTHYDFTINDIKNDIKVQEKVATVRKIEKNHI